MKHSSGASRATLAVLTAVAVCLLVSCGGDDTESSSTASTELAAPSTTSSPTESSTAPPGDVCQDREALIESLDALKEVDLVAEGTNRLTEAVNAVNDDLAALGSSASAELQPQVQAVREAVDELETAVINRDTDGNAAVVTATGKATTAAGTLLASLENDACGASTTPST